MIATRYSSSYTSCIKIPAHVMTTEKALLSQSPQIYI